MSQHMEDFARQFIKGKLPLCSEEQVNTFKRMYSPDNIDADIDDVVDNMGVQKLDWAMQQVERTLEKFANEENSREKNR